MDFKYPHSNFHNAIIETLSDEEEKGNQRVRSNDLYEKSVSLLNRSSKAIKKPSKTTFSQVLKKMIEDNIVKRGVKLTIAIAVAADVNPIL